MSKLAELYPCIRSVEDKEYRIPVLVGIAAHAVSQRALVNKYETNRFIRYVALFHLLKAISPGVGIIQNWRSQQPLICTFLGISERTLWSLLKLLCDKQLAVVDKDIKLVSWKEAAHIFEIPYQGTTTINYNPFKNAGKQDFQYLLRGMEVQNNQVKQLETLLYKLDQNLSAKNELFVEMVRRGADLQRLQKEPLYLVQQLLQLYVNAFKEGTAICLYIMTYRADLNRGVKGIQKDHCYKSMQSVAYMKRRMREWGVIEVEKKRVESKVRTRLYVPEGEGKRDGYKWNGITKRTIWFLCDQIKFLYESSVSKKSAGKAANAA